MTVKKSQYTNQSEENLFIIKIIPTIVIIKPRRSLKGKAKKDVEANIWGEFSPKFISTDRWYSPVKKPDRVKVAGVEYSADGVASSSLLDSERIFFEIMSYFEVKPKLPSRVISPWGFIRFFPLFSTVKTIGILSKLSNIFKDLLNKFSLIFDKTSKTAILGFISTIPESVTVIRIFEPIVALAWADPIPSVEAAGTVSANNE